MELKERVGNNVDWRIHLFRGYLEIKRKRNRVYNSCMDLWLTSSRSKGNYVLPTEMQTLIIYGANNMCIYTRMNMM